MAREAKSIEDTLNGRFGLGIGDFFTCDQYGECQIVKGVKGYDRVDPEQYPGMYLCVSRSGSIRFIIRKRDGTHLIMNATRLEKLQPRFVRKGTDGA